MHFAISVPVGAWHPFLPFALKSLKQQDANVSIALLDASNDPRVMALADEFDDWLCYRRHGPDNGQSEAILEGWREVSGDWLGWLNADDILMPGALDLVKQKLQTDPSADVIYGHSSILDERGAMTGYHFNVQPPGPSILTAGIVSQPSCFFRRRKYEDVGGLNSDLHYVMDWDLWIRLYEGGAKFTFIDACLSQVLWGADTKTASINSRRRRELNQLIQRHAPKPARSRVFADFFIHAVADRIYPQSLRRKVQRKLRSAGGAPFGIRGDGRMSERATLHIAHYQADPMRTLKIRMEGDLRALEIESSLGVSNQSIDRDAITLEMSHALRPGERCEIRVKRPPETEYFFRDALLASGD